MLLPDPALTLTIPSIHDGIVLDCRVYHPASLAANPRAPPWRRHAAIFAHPYAPMGGSYDDPVLEAVTAQLLRKGYLVGTFNFRGAGHSAGRTSWTSKPEREDYASFVGFMVYYIHFLDPFRHAGADGTHGVERGRAEYHDHEPDADLAPRPAIVPQNTGTTGFIPPRPVLLLCGYSYGAMVTTKLPILDDILEPFNSPVAESDAAQIRMRAEHLAEQQNLVLGSARSMMKQRRTPSSPTKRSGVRVGGDEGTSPRKSHESFGRRSFSLDADDKLRKGVHEFMSRRRSGKHGHRLHLRPVSASTSASASDSQLAGPRSPALHAETKEDATAAETANEADKADGKLPPIANLIIPQPAYLLVSPLQGLVTHLATMSLIPSALSMHPPSPHDESAEGKLVENSTLAIFGDKDVFVSVGKLRTWVGRMKGLEGSKFRGEEIATAGHFWTEEGVLYRMRDLVGDYAGRLIDT